MYLHLLSAHGRCTAACAWALCHCLLVVWVRRRQIAAIACRPKHAHMRQLHLRARGALHSVEQLSKRRTPLTQNTPQAHKHTRMHLHTHTHVHIHTLTHTYTHYTHKHAHTHLHTLTHIHTHTLPGDLRWACLCALRVLPLHPSSTMPSAAAHAAYRCTGRLQVWQRQRGAGRAVCAAGHAGQGRLQRSL